jgi:hypothetical protein
LFPVEAKFAGSAALATEEKALYPIIILQNYKIISL